MVCITVRKAVFLLAVFTIFLFFSKISAADDESLKEDVGVCKASLEDFFTKYLDPLKANLEPAEYRVEVLNTDPATLGLYARTIPDAYLIGFDPLKHLSVEPFVTPQVKEILHNTVFDLLLTIRCIPPYSKNMFYQGSQEQMFAVLYHIERYWGLGKETHFLWEFRRVLEPMLLSQIETLRNTMFRKKLFLFYEVDTMEQFTDASYRTLGITLFANAVVWNGSGRTYDTAMDQLRLGMFDTQKRVEYRFEVSVSKERDPEDISKDIQRYSAEAVSVIVKKLETRLGD